MKILVQKKGQKMWVKDPKKIKYWKQMASIAARNPDIQEKDRTVRILMEVS